MKVNEFKLKETLNLDTENIFNPISENYFFREIYEKQYYIFNGALDRFASLLSWHQANEILNTHQLVFPRLRLSKDGTILNKESYQKGAHITVEEGGRPILRGATFHKEVANGATVIIDYINEISRPIQKIAQSFEYIFQTPVQANAYLTKSSHTGFGIHWDSHDVFALQVSGRKYWKIYGSTVLHPLKVDNRNYTDQPTQPIWEGFLNSGQMIYIPRGCWHDAQAMGEESIHLSFGVHHKVGGDFINWGLRKLKESVSMRRNIPRSTDKKILQKYQAEMLEEVVKCLSKEDLYYEFLRDLDSQTMPSSFHLNLPYIVDPNQKILPPETKIQFVRRRRYFAETLANGYREIFALERKWKFPPEVFGVIEKLMTVSYLSIEAVEQELLPQQYSKMEIHAFVLGLVKNGLLTFAD